MPVYLITWDLNREKPNYSEMRQKLINQLSRYEHIKDPGLDSVWFISTTMTPDQIDADLRSVMHTTDRIITTRLVSGQHQGWLDKSIWDWINPRL
jgi:ribosome-binding factor A